MARKTWFALDCNIYTNPKVCQLSLKLHLDIDSTVGKLGRLWSWAKLAGNEYGYIGRLPSSEIAGIMRWTKKPDTLVDALVECRFLTRDEDGGLSLHDWYEFNGKSTEKSRKDRERHGE